ncbi:MAG TPA: hypothetical protein VFM21_06315 [Terriglobia bacterium]|nr:hypothetical protein [Terriglobia bacterium]
MERTRRTAMIVLLASFTLSLSSCSSCSRKTAPGGGPAGQAASGGGPGNGAVTTNAPPQFYTPPGAVFEATYTPNTVRIDFPTVQKTLRSVSPDAAVFVFDASDPRIRQLTEGKVMFLEHLGVRRILKSQEQGSQFAVLTEAASLSDFIQDGHIQFSVPINFRRAQAQALLPPVRPDLLGSLRGWIGPPAVVYASGENKASIGLHTSGEINDWEFEVEGEPEGDGFKLSLDAAKKLAGIKASVKTKGELSNITTAFNAVIHGSKVQELEYNTPLKGKLHVTWAALTEGENTGIGEARLKLPPFAKDVFDIYGIPMLFRIDEALIFKPGFGTKHDAAEGGFDLNYDGTGGLSVKGEQSTPEGTMQAEPELEKTTSESLAAHGIVLAVNAPKISISVGTEAILEAIKEALPKTLEDKVAQVLENGPFGLGGLVKKVKEDFFKLEGAAYVQLVTEFDYAGSGPLSLVPCTMTHLNFFAQAGADAQIGLVKGESPHFDLYKTSKTFRNPDVDACGQK